jgi:inosose dehydratase
LDETLAMAKRLNLRKISFKSMHLPLESAPDRIAAVLAKVKAAGLDLYAGGVIYMTKEAEVRQAFDYAKAAGMRIIVGVPNPELLPLTESLAKKYDISVAIHNHGPTDKIYPTARSVYDRVKSLDTRMGLCRPRQGHDRLDGCRDGGRDRAGRHRHPEAPPDPG